MDIYSRIYPSRLQPARIYGLPVIHKLKSSDVAQPFRPIVFSDNTYNYQLAKYLCNLFQHHLPSTYAISDIFSFVQELKSIDFSKNFMVSFDVVSLLITPSGIFTPLCSRSSFSSLSFHHSFQHISL